MLILFARDKDCDKLHRMSNAGDFVAFFRSNFINWTNFLKSKWLFDEIFDFFVFSAY